MQNQNIDTPAGFTKRANGNLLDCHRQWASRPADEAVFTMGDLLARTKHQRVSSRAKSDVPWESLRVAPLGEELGLVGRGGEPVALNNWSLSQLCSAPSGDDSGALAPAGFLSKLSTDTAAHILNERLDRGVARTKGAQLLVDIGGDQRFIRSITSDRYERVWDYELAQRLADLTERRTWQPAEAFRQASGDNAFGLERQGMPLGWVGDRSMFVCLVDYEGTVEWNGNRYSRFFLLSNSEVGAGALKLTFGLLDFVCCNFILWGCQEVYEASLRHTKSITERWSELSEGMSRQLSSGDRETISDAISAASRYTLGSSEKEVIAVAQAATGLPKSLVTSGYTTALETPRYGDPMSAWGMLNGITEASQRETKNADRRMEIDAKAARLMGLLKR